MTAVGVARCLLFHALVIMAVGVLAWSATYAVARGQLRRHQEARRGRAATLASRQLLPQPRPLASTRTGSVTSLTDTVAPPGSTPNSAPLPQLQGVGGAGEQLEIGGLRAIRHTLSSLSRRHRAASSPLKPQPTTPNSQSQPTAVGSDAAPSLPQRSVCRPGEQGAGTGAGTAASSSNPTTQPSDEVGQEPSPLPLTSFGIHLFEWLGVGWWLREWEVRVDALMDRADDGLVVRLVCLPLAGYSLILALLVRMRMSVRGRGRAGSSSWRGTSGIVHQSQAQRVCMLKALVFV